MSQFGVETQKIFCSLLFCTPFSNLWHFRYINFVIDLQLAPAPTIPRPPHFSNQIYATVCSVVMGPAADNYYNGQRLGNITRPIGLFCGYVANTTMIRLLADVLSSDNMLSHFGTNHVRQTQVPRDIHLV